MTIDRSSPDILIFDPPTESIRQFRAVHRLAIASVTIYFATLFVLLLFGAILLFDLMFRYKIFGIANINIPILCGSYAVFVSVFNSSVVYALFKINKPVLVQSCIFDRHAGELSIQQYNLFDRHLKTVRIPLNTIVDTQVRHHPILLVDSCSAISLMTNQSSKPVYLFQKVSHKEVSISTMRSLLEEVVTIRNFLNLSSEPPYMTVNRPLWHQILFTTPISDELIRLIDQNNNELIYNLQSRRYWQKVSWKFDAIEQRIKIELQTLIGTRCKYIARSEINAIAIRTEFLPAEVPLYKLARFAHRRQYQKQYSAILMSSNLAKLKPETGYWRIFTSTDLSLVRDLVDRVQAHLNLPLDELQSTESIALEPTGAIK